MDKGRWERVNKAAVVVGAAAVGFGLGRLTQAGLGEAIAPPRAHFLPWLVAAALAPHREPSVEAAFWAVYGCVALSGIMAAGFVAALAPLCGRARLIVPAVAAATADGLVVSPLASVIGGTSAVLFTAGGVAVALAFAVGLKGLRSALGRAARQRNPPAH